jgi:hypothetical protein
MAFMQNKQATKQRSDSVRSLSKAIEPMPTTSATCRHWRRICYCAALLAVAAVIFSAYTWWSRPRPTLPTEIFRGITYTCFESNRPECIGLVHIVKIDLATPGIQLYLTPVDPAAARQGYQYRLDSAAAVLNRENLAVVVNGAYFSSESGVIEWSGDLARGVQTVIADHRVSHIDPHSFLLWFESDLTPHLEFDNPPPVAALQRASWGIGGGAIPLWKGKLREAAANHVMDRRTAVAIDTDRRLLWLTIFENASSRAVAQILAEQGGQDGFLLDGGHSTTMVLSSMAAHVQTGEMLHGWRPVATFFGVRADALR